ncbi:MAG TPA: M56 family metallopeptidase [Bacteroidales bacterium]|jgi:TonB family protein|nr:M56 family metallopeptidase [Bacteroidales bacterium]
MIPWLLKSGLLLALFYLFYLLFMRKTTFFRFNRIVIFIGTAICLLLPLFDFGSVVPVEAMPRIELPPLVVGGEASGEEANALISWKLILITIYSIGAAVVLTLTIFSVLKTLSMLRRGERVTLKDFKLTIVDEQITSFSFLRNVLISHEDYESNPVVLNHELQHVKCRHSAEVLLFAAVTVLQWFNPLVWILRTELKMLHEYEADEAVINQGIDATQYQLLLVKKAVGAQRFQLANGFNHAKLKNRITMMQSTKSNKFKRLLYLACLPLLAFGLSFCNRQKEDITDPVVEIEISDATKVSAPPVEPIPSNEADELPSFNGGGIDRFAEWVNTRLVYPEEAMKAGERGRVLLTFTITTEGKLTDVKVLRGVSPALDAAAVRAVEASPANWTPGKKDGKEVPVTCYFPILFQLR